MRQACGGAWAWERKQATGWSTQPWTPPEAAALKTGRQPEPRAGDKVTHDANRCGGRATPYRPTGVVERERREGGIGLGTPVWAGRALGPPRPRVPPSLPRAWVPRAAWGTLGSAPGSAVQ